MDDGVRGNSAVAHVSAPLCAVVLAGGPADAVAATQSGAPNKAFVEIAGVALVGRVLAALRASPSVGRIVVVAPESTRSHPALALADELRPDGVRITDSLRSGLAGLPADLDALVIASDLPVLNAIAVDDFVHRVRELEADVAYGCVETNAISRVIRKYRTRGRACAKEPFAAEDSPHSKPRALPLLERFIERLGAARKHPVAPRVAVRMGRACALTRPACSPHRRRRAACEPASSACRCARSSRPSPRPRERRPRRRRRIGGRTRARGLNVLLDLLDGALRDRADAFALDELTYRDVHDGARRVATRFAATGVRAGDRVAIYSENRHAFVYAYLAALRLGAIAVPVNVLYRAGDLGHVLRDARPALVVRSSAVAEFVDAASFDGAVAGTGEVESWARDEQLPFAEAASRPAPGDVAVIVYTSGTTGRSKVQCSYANLAAIAAQLATAWRWQAAIRFC